MIETEDGKKLYFVMSAAIDIETGAFSSELQLPPGCSQQMAHYLLCQVLHKITGMDPEDDGERTVTVSKVH